MMQMHLITNMGCYNDVDYLVEDNGMDDICLSPELDGASEMPHLNIGEHRHF
jgi:hypothetical protein